VTLEIVGTGETQEAFGGTASGVSATVATSTGSSCDLHGWILLATKWSASLFARRCEPDAVTIRCGNGEVRELRLFQQRVAGDVRTDVNVQLWVERSSGTGRLSEVWEVFIAGRGIEDRLFLSSALSVTKQ
jgi:hypothetical protein